MSEKKGGVTTTNALADFVLKLYHKRFIGPANNWTISVQILRNGFERYLQAMPSGGASLRTKFREQCKTIDIVILLRSENFITNEIEAQLHINSKLLLEYSDAKLKKFIAEQQIWEDDANGDEDKTNQTVVSVDESIQAMPLAYQGNRHQHRIKFSGGSSSCFICQRDFTTPAVFKEHVHEHSEKTNFLMLNYYGTDPPALKLSYRICDTTGNYRFNMETDCMGIVIERIIFVLPDMMYYIHKRKVPYNLPMNTVMHFDLRRYLFRQVEQPIVVVFHQKNTPHIQRVEQHHYVPWQKIEKPQDRNVAWYLPKLPTEKFQSTTTLKLYLPEQELRDVIHKKKPLNKLMALCPEFKAYMKTKQSLTMENYCTVMNMLLHIEDVRTMKRYAKLEQCDVNLRPNKRSYVWRFNREVEPGLLGPMDEVILRPQSVEGEPATNTKTIRWQMMLCNTQSIAITNKANINNNKSNSNNNGTEQKHTQMFAGVVQRFYRGTVVFRCDNLKSAVKYTMLFRPARHQLRYQFCAIELLGNIKKAIMQRLLFPEPQIVERYDEDLNELVMKLNALRVGDGTITLKHDKEQALAVQRILNGAGNEAPYVVFGPPGTGKTATIASAIYELYKKQPSAKILVMSGSNYACDEITVRLLQLLGEPDSAAKAIVRICAQSYMDQVIDPNSLVMKYSNIQKNEHFMPSVKQMHEYRILICTLNIAGKLSLGGFGVDSNTSQAIYSHIFIDETQSATEAETLMGVMPALDSRTKLIIAGDPMQLGTFLDSKCPEHYGLGYSVMVRLLKLPAYKVDEKTGDYNRNNMIRLRNNYRSHPEIVAIFNELFYENKLFAKAPEAQTSLGTKWHLAPNPSFPIIFHNVHGEMKKTDCSKSFYNIQEVNVIIDYLNQLLCFGIDGKPIAQSDIGIITPYKEQYTLVREALYCRTWYEITVGTVEAFQGLEKKIILVSFVRTKKPDEKRTKNKDTEKGHTKLGFLKNENRINTILSRAKSLMLLIGDAGLLVNSMPMNSVIQKCIDKKTLVGEKFVMPKPETESESESDETDSTAKK